MRRLILLCIFAILIAAGALFPARKAPRPPNVLIVTLDTVRPDSIGRDKGTPAVEAFLDEATLFAGARTTVPLTVPAHVSLFSGLYPAKSGVHDNVTPCGAAGHERSFSLIAEQLQQRGYRTAAFVSNPVLAPSTGVDAGFDLYACPEPGDPEYELGHCIPAESRVRYALHWIHAAPPDRPWMAWVHLYDAHGPYQAWKGDARRAGTSPEDSDRERYAGELRRVDAALELLLRKVDKETIVVLVSDHGEGLGEHGEVTHGWLCFASCIDTFLAVRGPGLEAGGVDSGARSIVDIACTLRDWCGLPRTSDDGRPLTGPPHEVVVSESIRAWRVHNLGQCFASFDGRHTLIESGRRLVLYDRKEDPSELRPADPRQHPAFERLDRALHRLRSAQRHPESDQPMLETTSPYSTLRRPGAGYLSSADNAKLKDPAEHLETMDRMLVASELLGLGDQTRNRAILERVVELTRTLAPELPESAQPYELRAKAQAGIASMSGESRYWLDATNSMIRAVELGYSSWEVLSNALELAVRSKSADRIARVIDLTLSRGPRVPPDLLQRCRDAAANLPGRSGRLMMDRID